MNKRLRTIIKYVLFFGIGVLLVWWQFHKMSPADLKKFISALSTANYWLILPVIAMALASHISRSIRWRILIRPMGYNPSLLNVFSCVMAGYLANSLLHRVGEILKCSLLTRYEKIPVEKLLGTVVFERIFDLLCYLIFIVITIFIQFRLVGGFVYDNFHSFFHRNRSWILLWKSLAFIAIIVLLVVALRVLFKRNKNSAVIVRMRKFVAGLSEGISTVKKLKRRRWFLAHTFFIWTMYLLQVYVGFSAIHEISHLGIDAAFSVLTLATIAMIVMPGGLGAFPRAVSWVLFLYAVEEPIGEAFGFLMWGVTTFITLFFGLLFLGLMSYLNKRKNYEINQPYPG